MKNKNIHNYLPASKRSIELANTFTAERKSIKERLDAGKAIRNKIPRALHAEYIPAGNRRDPIKFLEDQARDRLPFLVPVRYARMLTSPFAFLRGSAAIMSADLAGSPATGIIVQACGDCHMANFGVYASAERNMVFAINDFDETLPAAWEWDIKRLASSAVVATRYIGGDRVDQEASARIIVENYRRHMRSYSEMGYLETWYATITDDQVLSTLSPRARKRAMQILDKAKRHTHLQVLDKLTDLIDNRHRIIEQHPFIVRETHTMDGRPMNEAIGVFLESYLQSLPYDRSYLLSRYRVLDVARKVVGVGSVGTRCWISLMQGSSDDDPLFLQIKQALPSVLAPYFKTRIHYENQGHRIVDGQRLIQGSPDIFLGWGEADGNQYYVRQLRDMKGSPEFLPGAVISNLIEYCGLCGWALALAHAKSGDAAMIAGYIGKTDEFDRAIAKFAFSYAEQTERDYDKMKIAAGSGRIKVAQAGK